MRKLLCWFCLVGCLMSMAGIALLGLTGCEGSASAVPPPPPPHAATLSVDWEQYKYLQPANSAIDCTWTYSCKAHWTCTDSSHTAESAIGVSLGMWDFDNDAFVWTDAAYGDVQTCYCFKNEVESFALDGSIPQAVDHVTLGKWGETFYHPDYFNKSHYCFHTGTNIFNMMWTLPKAGTEEWSVSVCEAIPEMSSGIITVPDDFDEDIFLMMSWVAREVSGSITDDGPVQLVTYFWDFESAGSDDDPPPSGGAYWDVWKTITIVPDGPEYSAGGGRGEVRFPLPENEPKYSRPIFESAEEYGEFLIRESLKKQGGSTEAYDFFKRIRKGPK